MRPAAAVLVLLAPASFALAGPWGLGKGHLYAKLGYGHLRSTTLAAPDGTRFRIPRFTKDEVSVYAAYGLSDRFTVIANLPLLRSSDLRDEPDELGRESGLGDVQAGLQVQAGGRGAWVFAARGMVQAPTGDESRAQGLQPTGSGVWEGEGVLSAGRSFAGGDFYGFAEAGHQVRGGGLRDGLVYGAQAGWNATDRLVLAANLRGLEPYDKRPPKVARGSFVGVGDRVAYLIYGPTAILKIGRRVALQLDLEGTARARNLAKGPTFRAGLSVSR